MAEIELPSGSYQITWKEKPLGFSIVMDTTGKNAYVSSIQKEENMKMGLKLAAQIIFINKVDVRGMKHQKILQTIKGAGCPMTLAFQPRSFAHDVQDDDKDGEKDKTINSLLFGGAQGNSAKRVNGVFIPLVKDKEQVMENGRCVWIHEETNPDPEDNLDKNPIYLWWFPKTAPKNTMKESVWMISRKSCLNTDKAYACCKVPSEDKYKDLETPEKLNLPWQVFVQKTQSYEKTNLQIAAKIAGDQTEN
eukprot:UN28513